MMQDSETTATASADTGEIVIHEVSYDWLGHVSERREVIREAAGVTARSSGLLDEAAADAALRQMGYSRSGEWLPGASWQWITTAERR